MEVKYGTRTPDAADLLRRRAVLDLRRATPAPTPAAASHAGRRDVRQADRVRRMGSAAGYRQVELQDGYPWYDGNERNTYGLFDVNRDGTESTTELYYNDVDGTASCPTTSATRTLTVSPTTTSPTAACTSPTGPAATRREAVLRPLRGHGHRRSRLRRRRRARRRRRPGPRRHPEPRGAQPLAASGLLRRRGRRATRDDDLPKPPDTNHPNAYGRVNPFNPCLPYRELPDVRPRRQRQHRRSVRRLAELVLAQLSPSSSTSSTIWARLRAGPGR